MKDVPEGLDDSIEVEHERMLSIPEIAIALAKSEQRVRQLIREGEFDTVKRVPVKDQDKRRKIMVPMSAIRAYQNTLPDA